MKTDIRTSHESSRRRRWNRIESEQNQASLLLDSDATLRGTVVDESFGGLADRLQRGAASAGIRQLIPHTERLKKLTEESVSKHDVAQGLRDLIGECLQLATGSGTEQREDAKPECADPIVASPSEG